MSRENLRDKFKASGISYMQISCKELSKLQDLLVEEVSSYKKEDPYCTFTMCISAPRVKDNTKKLVGYLKNAFFHCNGYIDDGVSKRRCHFKRREAISFNTNGFIGFAGWADDFNVQPFLRAFDKWINYMIKINKG